MERVIRYEDKLTLKEFTTFVENNRIYANGVWHYVKPNGEEGDIIIPKLDLSIRTDRLKIIEESYLRGNWYDDIKSFVRFDEHKFELNRDIRDKEYKPNVIIKLTKRKMTLKEIENELGYKILLSSEDGD